VVAAEIVIAALVEAVGDAVAEEEVEVVGAEEVDAEEGEGRQNYSFVPRR
jgi:hypothetical protein